MPFGISDISSFVLGSNWGTAPRSSSGFVQAPGGTRSSATYTAPRINYGASGVAPAGGMNLSALTTYINQLNRTAQQQANVARIPGAQGLEETSSANIASELAGNVDPSTIRLLRQQAAERGVNVGVDSPNADAAYLQALGLTSREQMARGQQDLTAAYARNPAAPLFDPSSQLLTPYQSGQLSIQEGQLELARQAEANRAANEAAAIALRGGGGGRAPIYTGGGGIPDYGTSTGTSGLTGSALGGSFADDFGRSQWWESIGYAPTTRPATTGSGTFFAGTPEEYNFREDLASVYPEYGSDILGGGY